MHWIAKVATLLLFWRFFCIFTFLNWRLFLSRQSRQNKKVANLKFHKAVKGESLYPVCNHLPSFFLNTLAKEKRMEECRQLKKVKMHWIAKVIRA